MLFVSRLRLRLHKGYVPEGPMRRAIFFACSLAFLLTVIEKTNESFYIVVTGAFCDAYLGVSVFVALTLSVFYGLNQLLGNGLSRVLSGFGLLQVVISAFLGALPGCGGALVVVTHFVHGSVSFGALVAVLLATMGDAAFLLLSREPATAALVYGVALLSGILTGQLVNCLHGPKYCRPPGDGGCRNPSNRAPVPACMVKMFFVILLPGAVVGLLEAFQVDVEMWLGREVARGISPLPAMVPNLGFMGAVSCLLVWSTQPIKSWGARFRDRSETTLVFDRVAAETSFVTVWVLVGFLSYEILAFFSIVNLETSLTQLSVLAP